MRKTLTITLAALAAVGCGASPDDNPGIPADVAKDAGVNPSATTSAAALEGTIGAGTWEVGTEVKPGTYLATAAENCYWARLKNFDGDLDSIITNGNLAAAQRGRITIKKTDKGLELSGDCIWVLDRKK